MPQPELPEPAHPNVDSMLSRKFGKEIVNYFSGIYLPLYLAFVDVQISVMLCYEDVDEF